MTDVGSWAAVIGASGAAGWVGNVLLEMVKSRGPVRAAEREADLKLEAHRDGLMFQILEAAREEVSGLRAEVSRLRPMESHLLHFEEALMHVERLLVVPSSSENRDQIEKEARAFLGRMRAGQQARGDFANDVQRAESRLAIAERVLKGDKT